MSKIKPAAHDLPLELTAEDVLVNLFDSDTWAPGLVEADPAEAARFICGSGGAGASHHVWRSEPP